MPEGHVLHRLAHECDSAFAGGAVRVSSPQGRFAESAALLDGSTLLRSEAFGKHLFLDFDRDRAVHVHLGLYGKVTFGTGPAPLPVGMIRLRLEGSGRYSDLRGPTACDIVTADEAEAIRARLGPDPIRDDADPDRAWRRVSSTRTTIGALLMDQSVFAGVGNIYRAEVLFRARVNPYREARAVTRRSFDAIWADLVDLMRLGVTAGRIDTVRPEHEPEAMGRDARDDRHGGEVYVYGRSGLPCLVCGTRVRDADLQGRSLYWCARCQRR